MKFWGWIWVALAENYLFAGMLIIYVIIVERLLKTLSIEAIIYLIFLLIMLFLQLIINTIFCDILEQKLKSEEENEKNGKEK